MGERDLMTLTERQRWRSACAVVPDDAMDAPMAAGFTRALDTIEAAETEAARARDLYVIAERAREKAERDLANLEDTYRVLTRAIRVHHGATSGLTWTDAVRDLGADRRALVVERGRSTKIAAEAAAYATEIEDLKARLAEVRANACGRTDLAREREEVVRLDKELGAERRARAEQADDVESMRTAIDALVSAVRRGEDPSEALGMLAEYARDEEGEHDAKMREWAERHPKLASSALGPPKLSPPGKPVDLRGFSTETPDPMPSGEQRTGYVAVVDTMGLEQLRTALAPFEAAARVWLAAKECTDEENAAEERMHVAAAAVACTLWPEAADE